MFLSRLILNVRSGRVRQALGDCQSMHQLLMQGFPDTHGEEARRSLGFLYRVEPGRSGPPFVVTQSVVEPTWSGLGDGVLRLGEASAQIVNLEPFLATITEGQRVLFRLLANPTRKVDTKSGPDGRRRNGRRVDVRSEDEQLEWLGRKLALAGLDALPLERSPYPDVRVTSLPRQTGRRGNGAIMTFGSVLFEGRAEVAGADAVRSAIASGVGSGKAYGFGLLSLAADATR